MSELLFRDVVRSHGHVIDAAWVRAYCDGLERKAVHDSFGWGWAMLMAPTAEVREEVWHLAGKSAKAKPLGCILCGDQPATHHHILAGRVCLQCFAYMPGVDQ